MKTFLYKLSKIENPNELISLLVFAETREEANKTLRKLGAFTQFFFDNGRDDKEYIIKDGYQASVEMHKINSGTIIDIKNRLISGNTLHWNSL